ncbi:putative glycosyltransferase family 1 protein [Rosellinia necatrix]|uniref:UDP-N-acetylglucosamine transferase subunit ALG13 n=1 Tax=Rosellinia necatrix TaxID=77044 RepID=A0A1S7UL21_ROSNE|nr:putative glycosyltransferase family 1 protein [Rosellinia necatrix]
MNDGNTERHSQDNENDGFTTTAFVTIGATAGFRSLLEEVVSPTFIAALRALGFTDLIVQCGPDLQYFESIKSPPDGKPHGIRITAFSYAPDLGKYFLQASRSDGSDGNGKRHCGVIISHAGSGSIIEALQFDSKLIAVPNPELMDNHQLEIAEEMDSQGFLVHGTLGSVAEAFMKIHEITLQKWPPGPSPGSAYQKGGLWEAINELMPRPS